MRFGIREVVFILLLLGVLAGSWVFFFEPRNQRAQEAHADYLRKQAKLAELESATAEYMDLDTEIKKLASAIHDFEQKLPADHREASVLADVTDIARKHRLDVPNFDPDKRVENARYAEKPIRLTIVGDFDRFYSFLLDLDKLPRITQIPQMTLQRVNGETDGMMEAKLTLSIFFEGNTAPAN